MNLLIGIFLSYLVGSIPTAYLIGKWVRQIDIREHGSGNVGATNVFRVVGKKWGMGSLVFDVLKGFLAASWAPLYFPPSELPSFGTSLSFGIAAIAGHSWTVWLGFKGGKGVATSLGVFLALAPQATAMALLVWGLLFGWKRYVSLASLGMALSLPLWVFVFYRPAEFFRTLFLVSLGLALFIFYTHRSNIQRLKEGREKRLF